MLVAQEHRGRGVGKQLMRTTLDYCGRSGIAEVKLDATPAGRNLVPIARASGERRGHIAALPSKQIVRHDTKSSGNSPTGIHYCSARSAGSCRNGLFWICRECAETCT